MFILNDSHMEQLKRFVKIVVFIIYVYIVYLNFFAVVESKKRTTTSCTLVSA